ncbi:TPA: hypothetical protein R1960_000817 [Staphylococcus delphini]|nr:hypothetical protein [Staphylococcus delphini]
MALNKHFAFDFEDRPKPKLWLLKPDYTRIERITSFTKLQGTFKHTNINQISFQIAPVVFDELEHEEKKNPIFDLIKNKYLIEYQYNGFKDTFVIDDIKKVSTESDSIEVIADSLCNELSKKPANEVELLGSTLENSMNEVLKTYAPLWSVNSIDGKLNEVKRELTAQTTTVMGLIEQLNNLFDSVAVFDNNNREISFYHKENVGVNRGLRIRENSYLKSFEDSFVSKDIITRLYPFGNNGLTIQSVNPAGTDYIEDFSYFLHPFKRDVERNVIKHSDYMSDELAHALLDYKEYYDSKKEEAEQFTKRYTEILADHSNEKFKLNQLAATFERLRERKELLTPKSEYVDLGIKSGSFDITVEKSSYYVLMIQNLGTLSRIGFQGQVYDVPTNDWLYLKIDTGDFQDALKYKDKLKYTIESLSTRPEYRVVLTRSSKNDYEDLEGEKLERKYNYEKYKKLVDDQSRVVATIERRMKNYEDEKKSLIESMNPKRFLSPELYKEREQFVYGAVWTEENHTEAKELYDDAIKQMKKQKILNRTLNISVVNFIQSLEDKHNWDKLVAGDIITFSNKAFDEKLKAYITDIQINFDENNVTLTVSDVIDYKNSAEVVSELIASTASSAAQVNFHKEQIREQKGKLTRMSQLIEAEWDANKKRVLAGNETVDIGSHGVKVISNENPSEFVIMVGGVIAMTKDNGETFKTGITPDGVNAEMLIGKMIVGESLTMENESGSFRFDKDGLTIDKSSFHLTSSEGEDYFDKLKKEIAEESKVKNDLIRDEFDRKLNVAISEAIDVEGIVNETSNIIKETFADGVITDVEKRLIKDTLATLEKENSEFKQQVEQAYNHPYILSEDIIKLDEAIAVYNGIYESLVTNINESISDSKITSQESKSVNDSLIQYREEVKDILVILQEIMERNLNNQLNQVVNESHDYADKISLDIKDELKDLSKSINDADEYIKGAFSDNIFDSIEIENIKTMLLIVVSELEDITNRHNTVSNNEKLPSELKSTLDASYSMLQQNHEEFVNYVQSMIEDGRSDEQEKSNYKEKYENYKTSIATFEDEYSKAILAISDKYSKDAEGRLQGKFDSLKEEIDNDLRDIKQNITEFESLLGDSFKDGIITAQEKIRIQVHLDMLDREFTDVEEQYKILLASKYINQNIRESVSTKRSPYVATHTDLRRLLTSVVEDSKVTQEEKNQVNELLRTYSTKLSEYSAAITDALNKMSINIASDVAATQLEKFNAVVQQVNNEIDSLQKQVDGAIETFYYPHAPTLSNVPAKDWNTNALKEAHVGDFFLNTKSGVAYRFVKEGGNYSWKAIEDQVITEALNNSKNALDVADGKRRTFVSEPIPPYDAGDIWSQGLAGDILVAIGKKLQGQLYNPNDWVKASKYTDDTTANRAISELNSFKESVNGDLRDLKSSSERLQREVVSSFEDKVISAEEKASLKSLMRIIPIERTRITKQGETVKNSKNLPLEYKNRVTNSLQTLTDNLNQLSEAVSNAIADNKITESESTSVDRLFTLYNNSLNDYEKIINEAIDAMILKAAESEAKKVQDRFDQWKSSEFSVETERIASRVSGSEWRTTYLPQIEGKIDGIQIGNRNLLPSYQTNSQIYYKSNRVSVTGKYTISMINGQRLGIRLYDDYSLSLEPNTDYVFKIHESSDNITTGVFYNKGSNTIVAYSNNKTIKFNTKNYQNIYIAILSNSNSQTVGKISLYKGNKELDWTPAPEDFESALSEVETKIQSNTSFIEQNKERITSSVSRTEINTQLEKVASYEQSYQVTRNNAETLIEHLGSAFDDKYSYEVTARTRNNSTATSTTAIFTSKGVGRGFELTILDEKGTTGIHPKFELKNNSIPAINTYGNYSSTTIIDVIYTKYLGTETNIQKVNSKIEQAADSINIEVKELKEKSELRNMLSNTDFATPNAYWSDTSTNPNFSFPELDEMSINSNSNMLLNNGFNNTVVGSNNYKRVEMKLTEPLEIGSTYTLQFETENDANISVISVIPHFPESQSYTVNISGQKRITLNIRATAASTSMLFYVGQQHSTNNTAGMSVSRATLVKGNQPLPYEASKSHRVAKLTYTNNNKWDALATPMLPVGDNLEYSVGDELTFSAYLYVPSRAKDLMRSTPYIELATYENVNQGSNPSFTRIAVQPSEIVPDKWFRVQTTGVIPATSSNGKTKFMRALLRYEGVNNSPDSDLFFYYGLPMLEKGNEATKWTLSPSDLFDPSGLASKIALSPSSIDLISQNLNINTDLTVIKNTEGNVQISGDTIKISKSSKEDSVSISPDGITVVKDGVTKIQNSYDTNVANVQAYEPQFYSYNEINSIKDERYNYKPHVKNGTNGLYYLDWGSYSLGRQYKQLIESNGTTWARVNRYTYEYNKRYLVVHLSCYTSDDDIMLHLRWRTETGGDTLHEEKISSKRYVFPRITIDLEKKLGKKPDNSTGYFELQAGLSKGTYNAQNGNFRITRMTMTDSK